MKQLFLILCLMALVPLSTTAQNMVSYAYDYAGNRISRRVVLLNSNPTHVKKDTTAVAAPPVVDQLGDRKITIYPNPTKGALAVDISGGDANDKLNIILFSPQGTVLQSKPVVSGTTPLEMTDYPVGWYILRITAGEKLTEFKIIKTN